MPICATTVSATSAASGAYRVNPWRSFSTSTSIIITTNSHSTMTAPT